MVDFAIELALSAIHDCASILLESASYILAELPKITIPESFRLQILDRCHSALGTRHDILSVLDGMDDRAGPGLTSTEILVNMKRILAWIQDEFTAFHLVVKALEIKSNQDPEVSTAYILVAGSVTNILNAYDRARSLVDSVSTGE